MYVVKKSLKMRNFTIKHYRSFIQNRCLHLNCCDKLQKTAGLIIIFRPGYYITVITIVQSGEKAVTDICIIVTAIVWNWRKVFILCKFLCPLHLSVVLYIQFCIFMACIMFKFLHCLNEAQGAEPQVEQKNCKEMTWHVLLANYARKSTYAAMSFSAAWCKILWLSDSALSTLAVITQFGQAGEDGKINAANFSVHFYHRIHHTYNPLAL